MKRLEEAYNYIEAGITSYDDILSDVKDIATDRELRDGMIESSGSLEGYASEIYASVCEVMEEELS